jgi:thermitase
MAPYARLLNVKVVQKSGNVSPSQIAAGIIWAADRGAMIINMSFTLDRPIPAIENAIDYAWSKGALIVAAVENQPGSVHQYPACYNHCLAVTATDRNNALCHWASNESWIDIAAPGESIYSTLPNNRYGYKSGTSMAAAYVTGLAACFFTSTSDANHNGFINDDVSSALVSLAGSQSVMSPEIADLKVTSRPTVLSISSISKATQLITNELITEGEGK